MTALEDFRGEMWSLFGLAAAFTSLRLFARIRAVGFRDLQLDDYLTFVAMVRFPHGSCRSLSQHG